MASVTTPGLRGAAFGDLYGFPHSIGHDWSSILLGCSGLPASLNHAAQPEDDPALVPVVSDLLVPKQSGPGPHPFRDYRDGQNHDWRPAHGATGWGATGKVLVFGLYKRNGQVLIFPVSSRGRHTLEPLISQYTRAYYQFTL